MTTASGKYDNVAVTLHWVMAAAFFAMLGSGLALEFAEMEKSFTFKLVQWHKSLGVLLLLAFAARLGWRLFNKPPRLPESIRGLEALAAKAGHAALYFFMFAMPFSGWLMASSSPYGLPTIVFGWFEWPHVPGVAGNDAVNGLARGAHGWMAYAFILVILGHVAAVVKHVVFDRENILRRMWWGKGA